MTITPLDPPQPLSNGDPRIEVLERFLSFYVTPSFGSPTKRDTDIHVFGMLRALNRVPDEASLFEIAQALRVTRGKARGLMFDHDIRASSSDASSDARIKGAVERTRFTRDGSYFVFEIEDLYVQSLIRERIRVLGHVSDSSFNVSLVRLSLDAAADLIQSLLSETEKLTVRGALLAAGAPDKSLRGVLKGGFGVSDRKFGGAMLDAIAEDVADEIADYLAPIFFSGVEGVAADLTRRWGRIYASPSI